MKNVQYISGQAESKSIKMAEETLQCPSCDRNDFESEHGMKTHHGIEHEKSLSTIIIECDVCGTEKERNKHNVGENVFCRRKCKHEWFSNWHTGENHVNWKERVVVECVNCGSEKEVKPERVERTDVFWCDELCEGEYKSEIMAKEENNPMMGSSGKQNREFISSEMKGEGNHMYGKTGKRHPNYGKEFEGVSGEENPMYGVTGEEHPRYGLSPPQIDPIEVEETGHVVRSGWEEEIDKMLYNHDIEYGYETKMFELKSADRTYHPDFIVGDKVIEVKGRVRDGCIEKAETFLQEYPEYEYIVVGSELPSDTYIPWEDREELVEHL